MIQGTGLGLGGMLSADQSIKTRISGHATVFKSVFFTFSELSRVNTSVILIKSYVRARRLSRQETLTLIRVIVKKHFVSSSRDRGDW